MTKLEKVLSRCKCSVTLEVNEHRNDYRIVKEYLDENIDPEHRDSEIEPEIEQKMIETDTVIYIRFYPHTPLGFYDFYHYDLDMLLDEALELLDERDKRVEEERRIEALPKITDYNTVNEFLIACALHNRKLKQEE